LLTSSIIFGSGFVGIAARLVFLNMPETGARLGRAGDKVIDEGSSGVDFPISGLSRLVLKRLESEALINGLAGFFSRDLTSGLLMIGDSEVEGRFNKLASGTIRIFGLSEEVSFFT
jgi:hypothetical protein